MKKSYPIRMISSEHEVLCKTIWDTLGYPNERKPLLIGIDGRDGSGKSTLANWLAWQLGMPAIHLDFYIDYDSNGQFVGARFDELRRLIEARLKKSKSPVPVIVEGVLLLKVLGEMNQTPDFLVFVEREDGLYGEGTLWRESISPYLDEYDPKTKAHFLVTTPATT